jgi:hypothetical protein
VFQKRFKSYTGRRSALSREIGVSCVQAPTCFHHLRSCLVTGLSLDILVRLTMCHTVFPCRAMHLMIDHTLLRPCSLHSLFIQDTTTIHTPPAFSSIDHIRLAIDLPKTVRVISSMAACRISHQLVIIFMDPLELILYVVFLA